MTTLPYLVMDIETGTAPDSVIDRALSDWSPPSNVKDPEKIAERRAAAAMSIREKSALLDGSPVTAWALACGDVRMALAGPDERELLTDLREALDSLTGPGTVLVGHNLIGFDLPRLRMAYIRQRMTLPQALRVRGGDEMPDVWDTMRKFRFYSSERNDDRFVSLRDVIAAFGLPGYKDTMNGSDAVRAAAEGNWDLVREYCQLDSVATEAVFLLMTSAHGEMK